jgi:hypothetical protein
MPRKNATKRPIQPRLKAEVPPFRAIGIQAVAAAAPLQRRTALRPKKVANDSMRWAVYLTWAKTKSGSYSGPVEWAKDGVYLGHVEARDEAAAREKAIKHYNVCESERFRLNIKLE